MKFLRYFLIYLKYEEFSGKVISFKNIFLEILKILFPKRSRSHPHQNPNKSPSFQITLAYYMTHIEILMLFY